MYVRGKGVEFARVAEIVRAVSSEYYAGNIVVHQDASPIKRYSCTYGCGDQNCGGRGSENGYGFQGRIIGGVTDGPGTRRSWSGRRGKWACWHAYGDVMLGIFRVYPHATITSAQSRYEGMRGFLDGFRATAEANVGSMMQPAYLADLCDCTHDELSVTANDYRIAGN